MLNGVKTNRGNSASVDSTTTACHLGATTLTKYDVYDVAGKGLGKIEEIVLDARTGCVRYAVLSLGGFLGIGQRRVAIPWSALTLNADSRRCVVDMPHMQFMAVPVPPNDPWLQGSRVTWGKENAVLQRQQGFLGLTQPRA